jgi:tape measure domain-containing protein
MGAAAELFVRVSADTKALTAGMDAAAKAVDQLGNEAKRAASPLGNLRDIIAGTAAGELLADGIKSAAQAMVGLGVQSIKLANELEQNKVAFTTMLGSAEKADAFLRDLSQFAASTPFELRGLTDSSKRLLAFGFDAQSILPIMNSVGNAVAGVGGGKEVLDGVTLALGQMAAKGKVSAEEMNQLAERGIPAWKLLAKEIGVSQPQAMKMAEKGAIDANTAIVALVNGMNKQFPDMMKKQSSTLGGALSNLQDSADQALTRIGESLKKNLTLAPLVQTISLAINNLTAAFTSGGLIAAFDMAFGPTTKAAIVGIGAAVTGVGVSMYTSMVPAIVAAKAAFITATAAALPFLALGAAVAFAAYPIIKNWENIGLIWDDLFKYMSDIMTRWYNGTVIPVINSFTGGFNKAIAWIGEKFRAVFGDEVANKLLNKVSTGLSQASAEFSGLAKMATQDFKVMGVSLSDIGSTAAANWQETWGGAMSASQGFTAGLFSQIQGQALKIPSTLTKAMTGLQSVAAASGNVAKKQADAAKQAEKLRRAFEHQTAVAQKAYTTFENMADAMSAVSAAVGEVEAKHQELGRAYDVAGEKAAAMRSKLSGVESAFGKQSVQASDLRVSIFELEQASKNGGKAMADAFAVVDRAAKNLDMAREKAKVLGTTWDETSEALKAAQDAMGRLIEQGLKPGNVAYDEQLKKLRDLERAQAAQPKSLEAMLKGQQDLLTAVRDVGGGIGELAGMLGIEIPAAMKAGAVGLMAGALAVGGLIIAVNGLTAAWATFTAAFATNPVGLALLAAGAAIVGIIAAVNAVREEGRKASDEAAASLLKAQEEADRARAAIVSSVGDALKAAGKAFIDGAANWGDIARMKIREGVIQAVLDAVMAEQVMKGMADMFQRVKEAAADPMSDAFKEAVANLGAGLEVQLRALEPVFKRAGDVINKYLPAVGDKVNEEIQAATRGATRQAESARISVNESHQASLLKQIERTNDAATRERLLSQLRVLQGRSTASDLAAVRPAMGGYTLQPLPGMATGGLVTGPTIARMGEGGRNEAVLPLNENVYRQIGQGIAAARGGGGMQLVVNYTGSGKWTREDAQGLGRMLVSELRSMGVR